MDQFFPIILTTKRHEMSIPKSDFYEEAIFEKMEILMEKKINSVSLVILFYYKSA
jgi:hypothetical protein